MSGTCLELQPSWPERYSQFASTNQYSVALLFSAFSVFAGAIFAIRQLDRGVKGRAPAIVTPENVQARIATADTANSVLALPPGSDIKIPSTRSDWI